MNLVFSGPGWALAREQHCSCSKINIVTVVSSAASRSKKCVLFVFKLGI